MSRIPLTLSCPEHGCRLEATIGVLGTFIGWAEPATQPIAVGADVAAMDRCTHEGLTTGMVTLPRQAVHIGV